MQPCLIIILVLHCSTLNMNKKKLSVE